MERITTDELRELAKESEGDYHRAWVCGILLRAANTIDEMDKDIAVFEQEIEDLHGQIVLGEYVHED